MKKKLYLSIFTILLSFAFVGCVFAADTNTTAKPIRAKAMETSPDTSDKVFAIMDDAPFADFSKYVNFTVQDSQDATKVITPRNDLYKIIIAYEAKTSESLEKAAAAPIKTATNDTTIDVTKSAKAIASAGDGWFTSYCLDGSLLYPRTGIQNIATDTATTILGSQNPVLMLGSVVESALANNSKFYSELSALAGKGPQPVSIKYRISEINGTKQDAADFLVLDNGLSCKDGETPKKCSPVNGTSAENVELALNCSNTTYQSSHPKCACFNETYAAANQETCGPILADAQKVQTQYTIALNALKGLFATSELKVDIESVSFALTAAETISTVSLTGTKLGEIDPDNKNSDGTYKLAFSYKDILLDKYSQTKIASSDVSYNHTLWIIEHSYPSLKMNDFLAAAVVSRDTLLSQLLALYPDGANYTDEQKEDLLDNYIYSTVQYAIWKVNGYQKGNDKLGSTLYLNGNADNELNKVYNYLIKDREEYTNYGQNTYDTTKVKCDNCDPNLKNSAVSETKEYYTYGPYKVHYDVMEPGDITIEVTNSDKTGITIVDKDGNEINKVASGGEFYIRCKKSAKIANVDLSFSASGRSYKENGKGTIYYSHYALSQNVITGLEYDTFTATGTGNVLFNPKTGVPNVAIVFIITLIAFSLGYLALSYNNKSMELN